MEKKEIHQLVGEIFLEVMPDLVSFDSTNIRKQVGEINKELSDIATNFRRYSYFKGDEEDKETIEIRRSVLELVKEALRTMEEHIHYRIYDRFDGIEIQKGSPEGDRKLSVLLDLEEIKKLIEVEDDD